MAELSPEKRREIFDLETDIRRGEADAMQQTMVTSLSERDPVVLAETNRVAAQTGLTADTVEKTDAKKIRALTTVPTAQRIFDDSETDPAFMETANRIELFQAAPDRYEEAFSIWGLAGGIANYAFDVATKDIPQGSRDTKNMKERARVGELILRDIESGVEPSEELLTELADIDNFIAEGGSPDALSAHGTPRVMAMGLTQLFDMALLDGETSDRVAQALLPEKLGDDVSGEFGIARKVGALAQLLATAAGKGKFFSSANTMYEAFHLERGNMAANLSQIKDDNGENLTREQIVWTANTYAVVASFVETASNIFQLGAVKGATAGIKARLFGEVVDAVQRPSARKIILGLGSAMLRGPVTEGAEEGTQAASEIYLTSVAKVLNGNFEKQGFEDLVDAFQHVFSDEGLAQISEEAKAGAVAGSPLSIVGTSFRVGTDISNIRNAESNIEAFKALAEGVDAGELRGRGAGSKLSALINMAGGKTKADKIYIEVDELEDVLNQKKVKPDDVLPGLADEIAAARVDQRPVSVPTGDFAVRLAGTPLFDELVDHVKFDKAGLSFSEAKVEKQRIAKLEEDTLGDLDTDDRTRFEQSASALRDDFVSQLVDTRRFTRNEAQAQAKIVEGVFRGIAVAMTNSSGQFVTPEEARALKQLTVVGPDVDVRSAAKSISDQRVLNHAKVSAAAVMIDGEVTTGVLHAVAIESALDEKGFDPADVFDFYIQDGRLTVIGPTGEVDAGSIEEGFVTDEGEFFDRGQSQDRFGVGDAVHIDEQADAEIGEVLAQPVDEPPQQAFEVSDEVAEAEVDRPEFKAWAGDAEVVLEPESHTFQPGESVVIRGFHGTTHEFSEVDTGLANPENDLGRGFYLSSDQNDVTENYGPSGPDLTSRIEQLSDRLNWEIEENPEEFGFPEGIDGEALDAAAHKVAREQVMGANADGKVLDLFVKMENPLIVDREGVRVRFGVPSGFAGSVLDLSLESVEDEEGEFTGEEILSDELEGFIEKSREISTDEEVFGFDGEALIGKLFEREVLGDSIGAARFIELLRHEVNEQSPTDENGQLIAGDIMNQLVTAMGFDGVIYENANDHFSSMDHTQGTKHFVVFDAGGQQVKSIHAEAFDPGSRNLFAQPIDEPTSTDAEQSRAEIFLSESQGAIIRMTNESNLSSFLHEMGHFYLNTITELVHDGIADERMTRDLNLIMKTLDVTDPDALLLPYADGRQFQGEVDKPHEAFARMFELYLAEGTAPSKRLEAVMARFHTWMTAVYGTVKEMAALLGVELNVEIRSVFDRMVATEDALRTIEEDSKPAFATRDETSMTEAAWNSYVDDVAIMKQEQREKMISASVKRVRRERTKQRRDLRDSLFEKYAEEVDSEPVYQMLSFLRDGNEDIPLPQEKLSKVAIEEMYQPDRRRRVLASLPRGTVQPKGGLHPQTLADMYGFKSAGEVLQKLTRTKGRREEIMARVNADIASRPEFEEDSIQADARALVGSEANARRLRAELGELRRLADRDLTPAARRAVAATGAPSAEASRARVSDARAALERVEGGSDEQAIADAQQGVVAAEAAAKVDVEARRAQGASRRRIREIERVLDAGEIRQRAKRMVWNRESGEIQTDRRVWSNRLLKAQKESREAVASRDYLKAISAIERSALLNEAILEADRALSRQTKITDYAASFDSESKRDKLRTGGGARELGLIDLVRAKFDMRRDVPIDPELTGAERQAEIVRRRERRAALRAVKGKERDAEFLQIQKWKQDKEEDLEIVDIDETLFEDDDRKHWKRLTVSQLEGLYATLKNMEKIARNEVADIEGAQKQKYDDIADSGVRAINEKNATREARDPEGDRWRDTFGRGWDVYDAMHIKMERLFRWMAGKDGETNPLVVHVWNRWQKSAEMANELQHRYTLAYNEIIGKLDHSNFGTRVYVKQLDRRVDRSQIMALVLNTGSESSLSKLMRGLSLTQQDVDAMVDMLSDEEMAAVQSIWDLVDSLWGDLSENHFQMTGSRPEKIAKRRFVTSSGRVMEGGYYPIVYDRTRSEVVDSFSERSEADGLFKNHHGAPDTNHGWVHSRNEEFAAPIMLDLDIATSHMGEVIHDLAYRRTLRDTWKIVHRPQLKAAIKAAYGDTYFDAIEHRIRRMAGDHDSGSRNFKRTLAFVGRVQNNVTVYALGMAFSTTVVQPVGMIAAIPRISDNPADATWRMAKAFSQVMNPLTAAKTRTRIHELSKEMKFRSDTMDRDLRRANAALRGETGLASQAKRSAFMFVAATDYITSGSAWIARYDKVMSETNNRARAVREADFVVRRSQGSGDVKDLAQIQDLGGLSRPFTMFYTYFSALYNEMHAIFEDVNGISDFPKALYEWAMIVIIPAIVSEALALRVPDEEDDELAREKWAATQALLFPFQAGVGARILSGSLERAISGNRIRIDVSPIASVGESALMFLNELVKLANEDSSILNVANEAIPLVGQTTGVPARQVDIITNNLIKVSEGGEEFGLLDLLRRRKK